jgi:hypothetical protein
MVAGIVFAQKIFQYPVKISFRRIAHYIMPANAAFPMPTSGITLLEIRKALVLYANEIRRAIVARDAAQIYWV